MMNNNNQRKKSVSFKETVTGLSTLHIKDYTKEEYHACFYAKAEYNAMKNDIRRTVNMIATQQSGADQQESRGVEHLISRQAFDLKMENRERAFRAVMNEQMEQILEQEEEEGTPLPQHSYFDYDDEKISVVYSMATRKSVGAAYMTGLKDARIAQRHQQEQNATASSSCLHDTRVIVIKEQQQYAASHHHRRHQGPTTIAPTHPRRFLNAAA